MSNDRFLLIKAWSYILWSDVDHVLGQLLIAELTNRIPVVYWSTHCLHNGFVLTNGFELYFEPVSNYTIFHIARPEYTYYPPIWDCDNLLIDDHDKETWAYRSIGDILCSNANVVVSDVHFNVYDLIPFIKKNHATYGMTVSQIYRYLFNKYIKIKPDIEREIQGFYNSWLKDEKPVLAVHVVKKEEEQVVDITNSTKLNSQYYAKGYKKDFKNESKNHEKAYKVREKGKVSEPNKLYHTEIRKIIDKYNIGKIFLLTDCEEILEEYKQLYGSRVIFTDCKRIPKDGSVSLMENPMIKRRRGIEIIKDTYLASKCDFFVGNDFSNLSHAVTRIREWPNNNVKFLYWLFHNRKYPVNAKLTMNREVKGIFKHAAELFMKLSEKYKKILSSNRTV